MLKKLFLLSVGILLSFGAISQVKVNRVNSGTYQQTQEVKSKKTSSFYWKYGVKAGVNFSSMENGMEFEPGFGNGIGFQGGILFNFRWGRRTENAEAGTGVFGLQPEILYSNKAVSTDAGDIKMNYIAVPLLLKIYPTTDFSIEAGPDFSYLISTSPSTIAVDGAEIKVGDCKGMNIGVAAGLAYDLQMGLTIGARYTYGLTDMAKNLKWKNSNIQVTVGWMF